MLILLHARPSGKRARLEHWSRAALRLQLLRDHAVEHLARLYAPGGSIAHQPASAVADPQRRVGRFQTGEFGSSTQGRGKLNFLVE